MENIFVNNKFIWVNLGVIVLNSVNIVFNRLIHFIFEIFLYLQFEKPGRRSNFDYPDMTAEAVGKALKDANLQIKDVQAACVGYVYGDSTCGQRAIYEVGMTGIPIFNVNNNCSTGSSALMLAKLHVEAGHDCVLALGFEKMERGSLTSKVSSLFFKKIYK